MRWGRIVPLPSPADGICDDRSAATSAVINDERGFRARPNEMLKRVRQRKLSMDSTKFRKRVVPSDSSDGSSSSVRCVMRRGLTKFVRQDNMSSF